MLGFFETLGKDQKWALTEDQLKQSLLDGNQFALQDSFTMEDVPDSRRCLIRKMLEIREYSDNLTVIINKHYNLEDIFFKHEEESLIGICLFSNNTEIAKNIFD